jgi:hypothetical protein
MKLPNQDIQQLNVIAYVNKINELLMGTDLAEAETALTLAVVSMVVFSHPDREERLRAGAGFTHQVQRFLERDDIVRWIKAGVIPVQVGHA